MGCSKSSPKKEIHSDIGLPQEIRKISTNLTYHLKELEKEEQKRKKLKISRRKEIIKITEEINKIDTKTLEKINKIKNQFFKKI